MLREESKNPFFWRDLVRSLTEPPCYAAEASTACPPYGGHNRRTYQNDHDLLAHWKSCGFVIQ